MVKKQRNETLLVEIDRKCYSDNLLKAKLFAGLVVTITPHKSLNTKKGVIRCSDLAGCSEEEIQLELSSQQVTEVRRIKVKREGEIRPTNTLILTFETPTLPEEIKVGFKSSSCVNCKGDHPAYSKKCPKWLEEKDIVRIKHTRNISFPEARRLIHTEKSTTQRSTSYADVAKSSKNTTTEASTQTDLTWPNSENMYSFLPP